MKDAVVRARVDAELKANAARALAAWSLELKRQAQKRDRRIAKSADVSNGQMLLLRPERVRGAKVRWPKASLV